MPVPNLWKQVCWQLCCSILSLKNIFSEHCSFLLKAEMLMWDKRAVNGRLRNTWAPVWALTVFIIYPSEKELLYLAAPFFFFLLFFIPSLSRSPNRVLVLVDVGVFLSRFSLFWYFYLDMRVVSLLARGGTFLAQQLLISLLSLSYWKWKSAALLVWFHVVQHFQVLHATLHTVSVWTPIFLCRKEESTHFPFLVTCFLLLVTCHLSPFSSTHTAFSDNP